MNDVFFPVESRPDDAIKWAQGLDIQFEDSVNTAEAVLLMGLPDGHITSQWQDILDKAWSAKLPIYCSNPDLLSPRAGAQLVTSPGALGPSIRQARWPSCVLWQASPSDFRRSTTDTWSKAAIDGWR